jgi:hypothetical protein
VKIVSARLYDNILDYPRHKFLLNVCGGKNYVLVGDWVCCKNLHYKTARTATFFKHTQSGGAAACCTFGLRLAAFETKEEYACILGLDMGMMLLKYNYSTILLLVGSFNV